MLMADSERQHLLYPGDSVTDAVDFYELSNRFSAPDTTVSGETNWEHGDLVQYLLGRKAITSIPANVVGNIEDGSEFSRELDVAKRSATIHLPETDYALPDWAAHFGSAVVQIVTHEHATNPRADHQIAQLRFRQYGGATAKRPSASGYDWQKCS